MATMKICNAFRGVEDLREPRDMWSRLTKGMAALTYQVESLRNVGRGPSEIFDKIAVGLVRADNPGRVQVPRQIESDKGKDIRVVQPRPHVHFASEPLGSQEDQPAARGPGVYELTNAIWRRSCGFPVTHRSILTATCLRPPGASAS